MKKITNEIFIKRINNTFNGKYDTSKVNYINAKTKVTLICPEHGEFEATPNHLNEGHGCPHCANRYVSTNQFIEKAKKVHGDRYNYSKVNYVNNKTPICITCKEHGDFWQIPYSHLAGNGCNKCNGGTSFNCDEFIQKANEIHNNFYDYSQVEYKNARTKVKIICPKHGEFWQTPECHLRGQGCPKCKSSKLENIVINALTKNNIRFIFQAHIGTLGLKTVDFKLLDYNIVIECQGEQHFIDKSQCKVVGARKCEIKEILKNDAEQFLNTYHIQGYAASTVYLGAHYNNELVGVMTFLKEKDGMWNLTRFSTNTNYSLPGLANKLFTSFVKTYRNEIKEVKSFLDRRWSFGETNVYDKMGFKLVEVEKPDYRYVVGDKRMHKFGFRKQKLNKLYNLPLSMTEKEMCDKLGFERIWDCGLYKYVWYNE